MNKLIAILFVVACGCSKDSGSGKPQASINFYNGTENVSYTGDLTTDQKGDGYHYTPVTTELYQFTVFGGAGNDNHISIGFYSLSPTELNISTIYNVNVAYEYNGDLYVSPAGKASIHINSYSASSLNGSFDATLVNNSGSDSIFITKGKIENVALSH